MTSVLRILSRAFHLVVFIAVLLAGCDGSGGSPGTQLAEPQFDLTGHWRTEEPVDCEESSDLEDLQEAELEGLLEALFAVVLDDPEFLAGEMGSDPQEFSDLEGLLEALFAAALGSPEILPDEMGDDLEPNELESDLSAVTSDEFRIDQTGNDLEVTLEGLDGSEARQHGTITGNQVRISHSEELDLQGLKLDLRTEISGTVVDEDRMDLTQESEWVLQIPDGKPIAGESDCTFHATRN